MSADREHTVAEAIAQQLEAQGVHAVWGMPGGDTLPVVDALAESGVPFYLVRDEASAGFAADASAQLTGATGACVATIGPGLTNLASGVAGCLLDRAPVIALTSRYKTHLHASYTHMMLDQHRIMEGTGKAWFRMTAHNARRELRRACAIASAPRPGPVWLEVPTEVAGAPTPGVAPLPPPPAPAPSSIDDSVLDAITSLKRPAILVGFGGRHCAVDQLAEALGAPVLTTYKAKGAIDEHSAWSVGAASLSPVVDSVHQAHLAECDGLVLIGWDPVELRDHWMPGWPDDLTIIVLDDHSPTDLPCHVHHLQVGPLPALVGDLVERLSTRPERGSWTQAQCTAWRHAWQAPFDDGPDGPATVLRAALEACEQDVVVSLDTGAHRITAANVWRCTRPDQLLQSNGFASMGYAIPAGLAACSLGHRALAITGDMGLQMVMGELMTAAEQEWSLTVLVLVDDELALIGLKQKKADLPSRGVTFANPAWHHLAAAVGGRAVLACGADEVRSAVVDGLRSEGITLVAAVIDPESYLRQM